MQPRSNSRIADSLASRLEQLVQRLSREHLTVGIILLVLRRLRIPDQPVASLVYRRQRTPPADVARSNPKYLPRPALLHRLASGSPLVQLD